MSNKVKFFAERAFQGMVESLSGGTILQIFMTNAGIGSEGIGLYGSLLSIIPMAVNLLFSKAVDEVRNVKKVRAVTQLLSAICLLCFLTPCFVRDERTLWQMTCFVLIPASVLRTLFVAIKTLVGFKLPYSIMRIEEYGKMAAIDGAITYGCCTVVGFILSYCLEHFDYMQTMRWAFGISALFSFLAGLICRSYRIYDTPAATTAKEGILQVMATLIKMQEFKIFIIPNFLRGISQGVIGVLAIICLGLGFDNATASALVTVTVVAELLGNYLYYVLSKRISEQKICLLGTALLAPMIFAFLFGDTVFLAFALFTLMGKALINIAVPASVYKIIQPEVACTYHAGRMFVTDMGVAVASACSGFLIERNGTVLLIAIGVLAQLISSLCYLLYRKRK